MERIAAGYDKTFCLAEVDIFADLSPTEMDAIAAAAPMKTYATGELLYSPQNQVEVLFILKAGRVRVFRIAVDGRALTTAVITPGTIFGEMVLLGQHMYDNYAEALEEAVVCVMNRDDVHRLLLSDPRIAARITAILGARLLEMERRLCDTVFKSVPQRVAATLATLAGAQRRLGVGRRSVQVALTHDQLAALVGTTRETATKVLGELAIKLKQPAVLGEIVAGVLLGGSVLGLLNPSDPVIHTLSEIGVIVLLFATGLHTDVSSLVKAGA
ncbi:MAG: cyclic nucleotide-binding domain-containing protein, partial [Pseudonocardiaceae bacterium]